MKKIVVFLMLGILILSSLGFSSKQQIPDKMDIDFDEKIMSLDLSILTPQQFYELEQSIIGLYSGSGGYFLGEQEIAWLRKAEKIFKSKGIKLKDEEYRNFVIADSYFNNDNKDKALEEFKNMDNQQGIELSEWVISNEGITKGKVKIKEYLGKIPCEATELAKTENDRNLFVSYFKGPVYRYDKVNNLHALVYAPDFKYDWCDHLNFKDGKLFIKLRDIGQPGAKFVFDNINHTIVALRREDE